MQTRKLGNKVEISAVGEEHIRRAHAVTPLAKGFLSGTYAERPTFDHPEDNRSGRYQFSEEGFALYQSVIELIRKTAEAKNATR